LRFSPVGLKVDHKLGVNMVCPEEGAETQVREACVAPWTGDDRWDALPWLCSKEQYLI